MRYSKTCFWRVPNYDDHCTVVVVIGVPSEIRCFFFRKSDMQPKDVVGAPGESDVSNNCPGQAAKGPISEKTQNIHQWSVPLARRSIENMCIEYPLFTFFYAIRSQGL